MAPFEWIISFNLGLVHLNTAQYASAFHFFSASINLKPDFASTYMYLAITLNRLDDFENACSAYEKALELETHDINFQVSIYFCVEITSLNLIMQLHYTIEENSQKQSNITRNLNKSFKN